MKMVEIRSVRRTGPDGAKGPFRRSALAGGWESEASAGGDDQKRTPTECPSLYDIIKQYGLVSSELEQRRAALSRAPSYSTLVVGLLAKDAESASTLSQKLVGRVELHVG